MPHPLPPTGLPRYSSSVGNFTTQRAGKQEVPRASIRFQLRRLGTTFRSRENPLHGGLLARRPIEPRTSQRAKLSALRTIRFLPIPTARTRLNSVRDTTENGVQPHPGYMRPFCPDTCERIVSTVPRASLVPEIVPLERSMVRSRAIE